MELYDEQAELDGVYCDICGNHHSPDYHSLQFSNNYGQD